jgi:catechol 2,3-dioxygenase-like lactoylglutathione lyase family enzyme
MEKLIHPVAGLAHIGIPCNDFNKSVEFYKKLGFTPIYKPSDHSGFFRAGDCVIELYKWHESEEKPRKAGPVNHAAFRSEDIDAAFAEVKEMGFKVLSNGIESNQMCAPQTNRYFIIEGPDGERLEFAQIK